MDLGGTDRLAAPDTAINREIELKLCVSAEAADTLLAAPLLAAGIPLNGPQQLDAAYYDTADLHLRNRGVSLRVRREGDRFVQTVKTIVIAGGALDRREWQTIVPDAAPRPDWITDKSARAALGHLTPDELVEICRTSIERLTCVVGYPHDGETAIIEVAFDRGSLSAGARSEPIVEVELELLKGNRQALYALALALHEIAPVEIELRSKAERAYSLHTGEAPPWHKAKKLRFASDATVADAIAAVFESCFSHWMANQPAALDGRHPEGLHQMRVALRRIRSALTLFEGVLPVMQARWLQTESRWLAQALGSARNWDVFLEEVLAPLEAKRPGDRSLAALRHQCETARDRHYASAREAIASSRYTNLVLTFGRWIDGAAWHDTGNMIRAEILAAPLRAFADTVLERHFRKLLKRGRGLAGATPDKRHRTRIAVKKMRYATDFFASLYKGKKAAAVSRDLANLQDTLGDLNDLTITERQLETIVYQAIAQPDHDDIVKGVGLVVGWCTARARRSETQSIDEWRRFAQRKPFWRRRRKS